ncbi:MAG: LLM class F420-dependent oxidoreductase [Gammaproteobacteria bacterium]|nr:LLM class F420-dependent oxidoreductase [Gammaproteobacteria bacterium]MBI5616447.1 LLM class F420-dependent oxidoreductase [Gammaproteobacteria bacterium]
MRLATMLYATDYAMRPDDFAVACEERGFESVWYPEHTHIPVSRRTPFPGGGELPREYSHIHDPFIALAAAATATKHIKIATGVCLVIERDPIVLAKEVATLDMLSRGRFMFGIGAGWNAEEMENHGTPFAERWKVLEERLEAMKKIWTEEAAEYHGKYVSFDPLWSWPKPVQKPYPPIVMGASTPYGRERVARYCDGWVPLDMMVEDLPAAIADLHARLRRHGRRPEDVEISIFWAPDDPDKLRRYQDLGVDRAILAVPALDDDATLKLLDRYSSLRQQLGG